MEIKSTLTERAEEWRQRARRQGKTLGALQRAAGVPKHTFYRWLGGQPVRMPIEGMLEIGLSLSTPEGSRDGNR